MPAAVSLRTDFTASALRRLAATSRHVNQRAGSVYLNSFGAVAKLVSALAAGLRHAGIPAPPWDRQCAATVHSPTPERHWPIYVWYWYRSAAGPHHWLEAVGRHPPSFCQSFPVSAMLKRLDSRKVEGPEQAAGGGGWAASITNASIDGWVMFG